MEARDDASGGCRGYYTGHTRLVRSADENALIEQLEKGGYVVYVLNGRKVTDLVRLYEEMERALDLPVGAIGTWEALRDHVQEELWQVSGGKTALVWRDATTLWERQADVFFWMMDLLVVTAHMAQCDAKDVQVILLGTWSGFRRLAA